MQDDRVTEIFEKDAQDYLDAYREEASVRSVPFRQREKAVKEMFPWQNVRVLDVGSGPGIFTDWLLDRGCEVWTLDIAKEMVHLAEITVQNHRNKERAYFVIGSIEDLPFSDKYFDAILCVGLIEYMENLDHTLQELTRIIAPSGHLIVTGPNRQSLISRCDRFVAGAVNFFFRPLLIRARGRGFLEFPYFHRGFVPGEFFKKVESFGFQVKEHRFTNFRSRILRGPFQWLADRGGAWLQDSLAGTFLETLGTNFIAVVERK